MLPTTGPFQRRDAQYFVRTLFAWKREENKMKKKKYLTNLSSSFFLSFSSLFSFHPLSLCLYIRDIQCLFISRINTTLVIDCVTVQSSPSLFRSLKLSSWLDVAFYLSIHLFLLFSFLYPFFLFIFLADVEKRLRLPGFFFFLFFSFFFDSHFLCTHTRKQKIQPPPYPSLFYLTPDRAPGWCEGFDMWALNHRSLFLCLFILFYFCFLFWRLSGSLYTSLTLIGYRWGTLSLSRNTHATIEKNKTRSGSYKNVLYIWYISFLHTPREVVE